MFSDTARLTYSIGSKRVTIMDNVSQNMFVRNINSSAECNNLSHDIVFKHVQLLQQKLVGTKLNWLWYKPFTNQKDTESTKIMEFDDRYHFIVDGKCAELRGDLLLGERNFDVNKLLRDINFAYGIVYNEGTLLRPKYDIVRLVVDAGIYVVKYLDNVMVIHVHNVHKGNIKACMFNDVVYENVSFVFDMRDKVCSFYTEDTERIWSIPIDFSVNTYFVDKVEEEMD